MSDDEAPKSAYEIAMAKLRAQGGFDETPLTDEQKAEIAEIRSRFKAKIAELEINEESKLLPLRMAGAVEEAEVLQAELSKEKGRLNREAEDLVRQVRERKNA